MKSVIPGWKRNALPRAIIVMLLVTSVPSLLMMARADSGGNRAEQEQAQARELWEAAVTAKGGRERLHNVSSLYVARNQSAGDHDYKFYVFPDFIYTYTYGGYREDIAKTIYNGRKAIIWWLPSGRGPAKPSKSLDNSENIIAQFTYLLVTNWLEPKPLRIRKAWIGLKRVDLLEVDANGWRVDYYLDPKTHLPMQVISAYGEISHAKGEMNQVVRLEDYKEVDGVMMPQKVSYSYTTNPSKWEERVSYEINPQYDPQFFDNPPTVRTGPESWRLPRANARN
jgi:hypothetical protein